MINTLLQMTFNKFLSTIFDGRLKQAKLATKTDIATDIISQESHIYLCKIFQR